MEAAGGGFRSREICDAEIKVPSVTNPATATISLLLLLFCFVLFFKSIVGYCDAEIKDLFIEIPELLLQRFCHLSSEQVRTQLVS